MKRFLNLLPFVLLALSLTSCSRTIYQVYNVRTDKLIEQDNALSYNNDDLTISYNLWGNGANMDFKITNKSSRDLYLDFGKSFFILNGEANDYYRDREFTESSSAGILNGYSIEQIYLHTSPSGLSIMPFKLKGKKNLTMGTSKAVTAHERRVICIPAHSFKILNGFTVNAKPVFTCIRKIDFPKRSADVAHYDESNSPLVFINTLTYGETEDMANERQIINKFYVTDVKNYSKKAALKSKWLDDNCYSKSGLKYKVFVIGGPGKFYSTHKR